MEVNLIEEIEIEQSGVQNGSTTLQRLISRDVIMKSECDETLLFRIVFQSTVRLLSFQIHSPIKEAFPSTIKLFINSTPLDFDDVEEEDPVQEITLSEDAWVAEGPTKIELDPSKFFKVHNLTLFISGNVGDIDETQLDLLEFGGITRSKKTVVQQGDIDGCSK
ncbi:PITH domain-containing protein 1-like protein [Aduncisulcus paluster]|uniref:PITH domain-containing protein 1-like protein n=1 Tax=Aduncisulcus paluster TaxID=2918883 RepID=A0ABQ5KJM0_9EUKA|nr:PITH domain-containing protein 1-like protein [Aduncisulcus paluster]